MIEASQTHRVVPTADKVAAARLGEELPIFCERCGYALHGLPQNRCEHCTILQFHCPECGHHQPINTLRPAVQSMLGRLRALALVLSVMVKIGFFGVVAISAIAMGEEFSYDFNRDAYVYPANNTAAQQIAPDRLPYKPRFEYWLGLGVYGFAFGGAARMLLLRWRRGWVVGAGVAIYVLTWMSLSAVIIWRNSFDEAFRYEQPFQRGFLALLIWVAAVIVVIATIAWPIWAGLVKVFLPARAADALLTWQRSMSAPKQDIRAASDLAREPT